MKIVRTKELAKRLSVSKPTLWRMEKRGELPPKKKISPRCVGWLEGDIIDWIQQRSISEKPNE